MKMRWLQQQLHEQALDIRVLRSSILQDDSQCDSF